MHPIPELASAQHGVFTTQQALAAGWSKATLNRLAGQGGPLVRLRRGAFAVIQAGETERSVERLRLGQRGVAAALRIPNATVSHGAAVAVHGLPLLRTPANPCVTLEPPLRTRDAALHVHRQPIPGWQLDPRYQYAITSVPRSCLDWTREAGLNAGVVTADAAIRAGLCTIAELEAVYRASCRGRAGLSTGRQLLELLDGNSESPLESVSRLAMRSLDPAPRTQVLVLDQAGQLAGWVDFYWDGLGLVGEADGRTKYSDDALWQEKLRQDRLVELGLFVVRWGWAEASNPPLLLNKVDQAMRRCRQLRTAGIPITARVT